MRVVRQGYYVTVWNVQDSIESEALVMAADMLFANLSEYNYNPMTTMLLRQARQSLISPTHKVLKVLKVLRLSE